MKQGKILVIDDDSYTQTYFENLLSNHNYWFKGVTTGQDGLRVLQHEDIDLTLLDLKLPDTDGINVLKELKKTNPETVVIIITAYATLDYAIQAMKNGAHDFLTKPFDNMEKILVDIKNAINSKKLVNENAWLKESLATLKGNNKFIGKSKKTQAIIEITKKLSFVDSTVLIEGESGTGKEVVAKMIHEQSRGTDAPFLPLNCGALPESLQESLLFGFEKGAFTGAYKTTKGYFEEVSGGTIFLDEIADAPFSLQTKLLRVLQDKQFSRIGSSVKRNTDYRLICASNKNLKSKVLAGEFRDDLYYRIAVVYIFIPPLRERKEDIALLADHFLQKRCEAFGMPAKKFTQEALETLAEYYWEGNVRELENFIENLLIFHEGKMITKEDLPQESVSANRKELCSFNEAKEHFEQEYFKKLLNNAEGNYQKAAMAARIDLSTLYRKIKKLHL